MKKAIFTCLTAAGLALGAGPALSAGKLSVYHWFEYIPQELLDKFAAEHDVEVTMDTYDSNEALLAALKGGKLGSYDVAVPGDYMVEILAKEGMLDTIAAGELANKDNILPQWADVSFDPGRMHSIPYQWGSTSFTVSRDAFQGDIRTTDMLFNPPAELSGKINVLDSQGELLALASIHLGIEQCSSDKEKLKQLNALVQGAKGALGVLHFRWRQGRPGIRGSRSRHDLERLFRQGPGGKRRARVFLSEGRLPGLDGQCCPAERRPEPGERPQVHGFPA